VAEKTVKIKAIIFDCFGVLVSEGWLPFKYKYFGDDSDKFELATAAQKRADAGLVNHTQFVETVAALANIDVVEAHKQIDNTVTDEVLLKYIQELKQKYKIGFISNASQNWLGEFFTPEQTALFDQIAISSETGFLKPDPRAYEHIADLLDTPIEECVLVDDQVGYCDGARAVGMQAIAYKDVATLKIDLQSLLA
jgi:putative hydrolase of the HAD superfamily